MGSGGPRGLQIPRSGADRVRGGFDSHAFPPLLALGLLIGALASALPARAVEADSTQRPVPGSDAIVDTTARRTVPGRARWTEQPRVVMLRSLLVPGWGQFHNRAYVKSAVVAGAEATFGVQLIADLRELDRLILEVDRLAPVGGEGYELAKSRYNARLDRYVGRQWMFAGVLAYALVDAYVDAHFRDFEIEFQMDPALPEGAPSDLGRPARGRTGGGTPARIALRWNF